MSYKSQQFYYWIHGKRILPVGIASTVFFRKLKLICQIMKESQNLSFIVIIYFKT